MCLLPISSPLEMLSAVTLDDKLPQPLRLALSPNFGSEPPSAYDASWPLGFEQRRRYRHEFQQDHNSSANFDSYFDNSTSRNKWSNPFRYPFLRWAGRDSARSSHRESREHHYRCAAR